VIYPIPELEEARKRRGAQAAAWTEATARRLQISPEAVLAAVSRGWTAEAIDRVSTAVELLGRPPIAMGEGKWRRR